MSFAIDTNQTPRYKNAAWWDTFKEMILDEPIQIKRTADIFLKEEHGKIEPTPWMYIIVAKISTQINHGYLAPF